MDDYWILVGMMGSGKTTIGRELARMSGREFEDTDSLLEARIGRPIPLIFRVYGEEAFRDHETSLLRSLENRPGVLSTGGGIVLREANWAELRRLGRTIWLDVPGELLCDRLGRSRRKRPLLETDDWEKRLLALLEQRREHYAKADLRVEVGNEDVADCAERILAILRGTP